MCTMAKIIKVGKLAKERNSLILGGKKKNQNIISLKALFSSWTSDKNLEICYGISHITLSLVQTL